MPAAWPPVDDDVRMRFWTHYWRTDTARSAEKDVAAGAPRWCDQVSGNQFVARGVAPGDTIYVITLARPGLRVLGRLVVGEILDRQTARQRLGHEPWDASEHIFAAPDSGSRLRFDLVVPLEEVHRLEFVTSDGLHGPVLNQDGTPNQQTFRGVREIAPSTATVLDTHVDV